MAFWGIEVRPGKPFTHSYDESRGRLRISQATLGDGKGSNKSVLQCNVGDKSPILLCNLIPNVSESCHLELEFEENDDVIFSVLGQRSVHLSGYYLGSGGKRTDDSDESYGEDIAETESEDAENYYDTEDDEYESDFIDDDDIEMFSAPRRKSNVVIKEIEEEEKPANGNAGRRRLKKKCEISDCDEGDVGSQRQLVVKSSSPKVLESEDEDGFPISFSVLKKSTVKKAEACENSDQMNSDDKKRKVGTVVDDVGLKRKLSEPLDSFVPADIAPESNENPKKKKKVKGKKALQTDEGDGGGNGNEGQLAQGKVEKRVDDLAAGAEVDKSVDGGLLRKVKKEKKHRIEEIDEEDQAEYNGMDEDIPDAVGQEKLPDVKKDDPSSIFPNTTTESNGKRKKDKKKKVKNAKSHDSEGVSVGEGQEENTNANEEPSKDADIDAHPAAADEKGSKKKKKKNKNIDNVSKNEEASNLSVAEEKQSGQGRNSKTYPNGLVVEELSMGQPDGKRASPGTKVSVQYIGRLKNGKIFDSSVGGKPFKFRLGIGQVIKGWDVGINGMRIGDKRKLTIPPSMGYGNKNVGKIPANSWLVFDVELVNVQ